MGDDHRIAFVVPTKDRPHDLARMLESLRGQTRPPDQVVIVDGGDDPVADVLARFRDLPLEYHRVRPPSLARQRNVGMVAVQASMTLAGYLDDDLVLEPGAVEAMLAFWANAGANVGGATFNIVNAVPNRMSWFHRIFLLASRERGAVLRSGFETHLWPVDETVYVRWLCGGATVWRRHITTEILYDEWFDGFGYLEDIDYSYRVGRHYRLAVVGDARVRHLTHTVRRDRNYLLGKWQAINRVYFVRKNPELSAVLCYWALWGLVLHNVGVAIVRRDPARGVRVIGNLAGLAQVARGRLDRLGGLVKD